MGFGPLALDLQFVGALKLRPAIEADSQTDAKSVIEVESHHVDVSCSVNEHEQLSVTSSTTDPRSSSSAGTGRKVIIEPLTSLRVLKELGTVFLKSIDRVATPPEVLSRLMLVVVKSHMDCKEQTGESPLPSPSCSKTRH